MSGGRRSAIVALATPPRPAERAILRLSGPDLAATLAQDGLPAGLESAWAATAGQRGVQAWEWSWLPGILIPVELWCFPGPQSATGEDVLEFHLPGSLPVVRALEAALLQASGLDPAEAGEFTRRAFLNGVLDLTQAEAVQALVQAQDTAEVEAAAALLGGALGADLQQTRDALAEAMVQIEAGLDFEEGDSQDLRPGEIASSLDRARAALARGRAESEARRGRHEGRFRIGLVGAPNAGKTALFRRLTGVEALVADEKGTTRDRLEAAWPDERALDRWMLADGPGRAADASDARDHAAQARARQADHFDFVVYVVDGSDPRAQLPEAIAATPGLTVFSKADRPRAVEQRVLEQAQQRGAVLWLSSEAGTGLEPLAEAVGAAERARHQQRGASARASVRHQEALRRAAESVEAAAALDEVGGHQDLVAEELRAALRALAELVGEFTPEDLLDQLFSSFCVGK